MKKQILTLLLSLCSTAIFANGVEIDGIYYLLDNTSYSASVTCVGSISWGNGGTTFVYAYSNYTGDVIIPDTIVYGMQKYCVTSIGEGAFFNCSGIESVEIYVNTNYSLSR